MKNGKREDYLHPFADRVNRETAEDAVERVVSIGLTALLEWWERVKGDTNPCTYGVGTSEFSASVAYIAAGGRVARSCADESAPKFQAAIALGAEVNWT